MELTRQNPRGSPIHYTSFSFLILWLLIPYFWVEMCPNVVGIQEKLLSRIHGSLLLLKTRFDAITNHIELSYRLDESRILSYYASLGWLLYWLFKILLLF